MYHRAKSSALYDCYWWVVDKRIIQQRRREVEFYRQLLTGYQPGDMIFDIGANHGSKTEIFLKLGAKVVALEPDELNQEILRHRFLEYRFAKKPVVIVTKAVSDRESVETIWIDAPGSAKNSLSREWVETLRQDKERFGETLKFSQKRMVETVTLEQLIEAYGVPFFIKIDVEGYEVNVLRGLRRRIPFVSFELNLPEFLPEGLECLELLENLASDGCFNFAGDCAKGLAMERWTRKAEFADVLRDCDQESIEVFWAAPTVATA